MRDFSHFHPTRVIFGRGKITAIGELAGEIGTTCLLVSYHPSKLAESQKNVLHTIENALVQNGLKVVQYFGAEPNPSTECVDEGVNTAVSNNTDCIVAVGGGSVIDTSKMIAFKIKNPDVTWEQFFSEYAVPFAEKEPESNPAVPLIAVSTTSGTGSQVTQAAVITNPSDTQKTGIFHEYLYPKIAVVDPEVMLSVPPQVTADTGFDAFCHAFESYINNRATPYSEILSLEAIRLIFQWLPIAVKDGSNIEAREAMAFADTLAGMSLSAAGAALPHPLGEHIGSMYTNIPHGRSMAVIYPEFMRFSAISAVEKFARVGHLLNPRLATVPDQVASVKMCNEFDKFLKKINMWYSLQDLGIDLDSLHEIPSILARFTIYFSPKPANEEDIRTILKKANKR